MNVYLDAQRRELDRLCKNDCTKNAMDAMDSLRMHLDSIATAIDNVSYANDGQSLTIKKNAEDFSQRVVELSDALRSLVGKIDDAAIQNMAKDIDQPQD